MIARWIGRVGLFGILVLLAGCTVQAPDLGPPEGWQGTDVRWWRAGVDTAGKFRNLEALADMGINVPAENLQNLGNDQYAYAVKRSLIELFRNQPQVVDSLFERYVRPEMAKNPPTNDLGAYVDRYKRRGYDLIRNHFREPRAITRLGEDIPVTIPDSLRGRGIDGTVNMQVFIGKDGKPEAVELLSGLHPVLDSLAMRATTQMEWRPAYYRRSGNWREMSSWQRFNVRYGS